MAYPPAYPSPPRGGPGSLSYPPGTPGKPGMPGAPPMPGPPFGSPGMAPGMNPGTTRVSLGMPPPGFTPNPDPDPRLREGDKKKRKKKRKGDKGWDLESSSSSEDECENKVQNPPTQIFITTPSPSPPPMNQGYGCCYKSNCPELGGRTNQNQQDGLDMAKMCAQQCYQGQEIPDEPKPQVICCPPQTCRGCQQLKQRQQQKPAPLCDCCSGDANRAKKKKPQSGTMEGMMPATQQFLMFLQAYGLAAALIRDRNRREDERAEKEKDQKEQERGRSGSKARDQSKGSRKGSKSTDRGKKGDAKEKKKKE